MVLALEGGYTGPAVSEAVLQCIKTLVGEPGQPGVGVARAELERIPAKQAVSDITNTIANHVGYHNISDSDADNIDTGIILATVVREQLLDKLLPPPVP